MSSVAVARLNHHLDVLVLVLVLVEMMVVDMVVVVVIVVVGLCWLSWVVVGL